MRVKMPLIESQSGGRVRTRPFAVITLVITVTLAIGYILTLARTADAATRTESAVGPPAAGSDGNNREEVSCTSATNWTAVGYYYCASGSTVTLAEQWNGTTWTVEVTPSPAGADESPLNSVSCTAASTCTAVGEYQNTLART
jgi:hypothetical protein